MSRIWDSCSAEEQRLFFAAASRVAWTAIVRRWDGVPEESRMTYIGVDPHAPAAIQALARSLLRDVLGIETIEDLDRMAGDVVAGVEEHLP